MLKPLLKNKKGQTGLNLLYTVVILVFMIGFIAGVMAYINSEFKKELTANSTEYYVIENATKGISNITGKLGLIGTITAFVAIILLVVIIISVLRGGRRGGAGLPG